MRRGGGGGRCRLRLSVWRLQLLPLCVHSTAGRSTAFLCSCLLPSSHGHGAVGTASVRRELLQQQHLQRLLLLLLLCEQGLLR